MKTRIIIGLGLTAILALSILSCDEEPRPTQVWGKFFCNQCGPSFQPSGTLAGSGADYYGWCQTTDTGLSFVVAQKNPTDSDFSSEYYFEVLGIKGPPAVGVYGDNGIEHPNDPSLYTTFTSMRIIKTNEWTFDQDDIPDPDQCHVRLFAEPAEEELTLDEYGAEPFEFFVYIDCNGISVPSNQGSTLTGTSLQVFFDECD